MQIRVIQNYSNLKSKESFKNISFSCRIEIDKSKKLNKTWQNMKKE